jgi:hypothetical protein
VARGLDRFTEIQAVHLDDVYDLPQSVSDVQWIGDAGDAGWIGVTQNFKIGHNEVEMETIRQHRTKVFSLCRADYPPITWGLVLGRNLLRIHRRVKRDEGCFWRISERPPIKDLP